MNLLSSNGLKSSCLYSTTIYIEGLKAIGVVQVDHQDQYQIMMYHRHSRTDQSYCLSTSY